MKDTSIKDKLIKELIVVLLSIDYQCTDHVLERFEWQEKELVLEFNIVGDDNRLFFCSSHFINGFGEPNIEAIGRSELEHKVTYTIPFDDLDSFFKKLLEVIDNTEDPRYTIIVPFGGGPDYYSRIPRDLFGTNIKDIIMDAIYGEKILHLESEVVRLLSKTTEFSFDGIIALIQYSKDH